MIQTVILGLGPSVTDENHMNRNLQNRRILITGASSGIGRPLAEQLAQQGARLALAARSEDKLQEIADRLGRRRSSGRANRRDRTEDRQRLLDRVVEQFGGLDVLDQQCRHRKLGHFADSTEEILRQIMEVNFFAPAELIRLAIPILTDGEQPAIVNVSSMCGRRAMPAWTEYSASKFALCGLTEALRGELARFDIDVLLVLPGLTRSDFSSICCVRRADEDRLHHGHAAGEGGRGHHSAACKRIAPRRCWAAMLAGCCS